MINPDSAPLSIQGSDVTTDKSDFHTGRLRKILPVIGFLLPNLVGFGVFTFFPVLFSFGMAFTNWSLKPAVELEWAGLANFVELLGVEHRNQEPVGMLAHGYYSLALLLLTAALAAVWSRIEAWRGIRLVSLPCFFWAVFLLYHSTVGGGHHSFFLASVVLVLLGIYFHKAEEEWRLGFGSIWAVIVVGSSLALSWLHGSMWSEYVPRDERFWHYLFNTVYLMMVIPLNIAGSLTLAVLLNKKLPLGEGRERLTGFLMCIALAVFTLLLCWSQGWRDLAVCGAFFWFVAGLAFQFNVIAFRTLYYLPTFTAGVAIMILWKALYNPETGPINQFLMLLPGMDRESLPQWLSSVIWAKPALMIMNFWIFVGGVNMLLYLAALTNVPEEILEAAEIDGANAWQRFCHVTLPQLAPTTFFITVVSIIGGLQGGFEQARVMTQGGPAGSTTTLSYYIYEVGFSDLELGYASTVSWTLFLIIFAATTVNWKFGRSVET